MLLYNSAVSGNCYKVRLLFAHLGIEYERRSSVVDRSNRAELLGELNPGLRVPTLVLDDGRPLGESNAILWYFGDGTQYVPEDPYERAQVLQWMFFEQYSHEPYIAVVRFWLAYSGTPEACRAAARADAGRLRGARRDGAASRGREFLVGERYSIADISLYAYTHVAHEGDFDLVPLSGDPRLARPGRGTARARPDRRLTWNTAGVTSATDALQVSCERCGEANPAHARFCHACGARLDDARPREERKLVSVLFVDLEGFTTSSDRADPEDVRDSLERYHAAAKDCIEQFGGVVEKFIGDAVMAVFGAPVAHGDDAERAVRAGLGVLERVAALGLRARAAVETGEAVVRLVDPASGQAIAMGDVVNTASRLQSHAPTGRLLAGDETHRAARHAFVFEPVAPLEVKGKREPLAAWMVGEPHRGRRRARVDRRPVRRTRPGARRRPLALGAGDRRAAAAGHHRARHARGRQVAALPRGRRPRRGRGRKSSARALPSVRREDRLPRVLADGAPARGNLRFRYDARRPRRAGGPRRGHFRPGGDAEPHARPRSPARSRNEDAALEQRVLFFSARRLVERIGEAQPTLVVFEDVHWGAASELDLFEYLGAHVGETRVLFIALARPELVDTRPAWGAGSAAQTRISLEPLQPTSPARWRSVCFPIWTRTRSTGSSRWPRATRSSSRSSLRRQPSRAASMRCR